MSHNRNYYESPTGVIRDRNGNVVYTSPLFLEGCLAVMFPKIAPWIIGLSMTVDRMIEEHPVATFLGFTLIVVGLFEIFGIDSLD